MSGGNNKWPAGRHGVCGDPAGKPQDHVMGGKYWGKIRKVFGGMHCVPTLNALTYMSTQASFLSVPLYL